MLRSLVLKLYQRQVAEPPGFEVSSLRSWEANRTKPTPEFMPAIIRFLGYNPLPPATSWAERLVSGRRALGISAASLGRLLDPITQDACAFYKDHGLFDDFPGVYETAEGDRIAQAPGNKKAVILRNHGLLTVGSTVDGAAWWFITMDRSCQVQILAASVDKPVPIATNAP